MALGGWWREWLGAGQGLAQPGCATHCTAHPLTLRSTRPLRPPQTLAEACALCNDARVEFKHGHHRAVGQPTEAALLVLAEKLGVGSSVAQAGIRARRSADREGGAMGACSHHAAKWAKLATLEFDRDRKVGGVQDWLPRGPAAAPHSLPLTL